MEMTVLTRLWHIWFPPEPTTPTQPNTYRERNGDPAPRVISPAAAVAELRKELAPDTRLLRQLDSLDETLNREPKQSQLIDDLIRVAHGGWTRIDSRDSPWIMNLHLRMRFAEVLWGHGYVVNYSDPDEDMDDRPWIYISLRHPVSKFPSFRKWVNAGNLFSREEKAKSVQGEL